MTHAWTNADRQRWLDLQAAVEVVLGQVDAAGRGYRGALRNLARYAKFARKARFPAQSEIDQAFLFAYLRLAEDYAEAPADRAKHVSAALKRGFARASAILGAGAPPRPPPPGLQPDPWYLRD